MVISYPFFNSIFNPIKTFNHFLVQLPPRKGVPSKKKRDLKLVIKKTKTKIKRISHLALFYLFFI